MLAQLNARQIAEAARGSFIDRAVDRVVQAISPSAAIERKRDRIKLAMFSASTRAFDGAGDSRSWANKRPKSTAPNTDLDDDTLATLRSRSRDRWRNDGLATALVQSFADNVVGTGFNPHLQLDNEALGLTFDRARQLEREAFAHWRWWSKACDSANRLHFDAMQAMVVGQTFVNGEVFVRPLMLSDKYSRSPYELRVELIEGDRVDTPDELRGDPTVINGVKVGSRGQPIGYYVHEFFPDDFIDRNRASQMKRGGGSRTYRLVPTVTKTLRPNMLHVYDPDRPGQVRGRPAMSAILDQFKDLNDYRKAELVAAQVSACFAAFIKRTDPVGAAMGAATPDTRNTENREEELNPGLLYYLEDGEDVSFGNPTRPNANYGTYVSQVQREITAAVGMPYEVATRDYSGITYAQARAGLVEVRRMFARRGRWLTNALLQPLFEMLLEELWLKGLWAPEADLFGPMQPLWTSAEWIGQGYGWLDPYKEAAAEQIKLTMGVTSRQKIVAQADGESWHRVAAQLAEEAAVLAATPTAVTEPGEDRDGADAEVDATEDDDSGDAESGDGGSAADSEDEEGDESSVGAAAVAIPSDEEVDES